MPVDAISPWVAAVFGIVVFAAVNRWFISVYLAATGRDSMRQNAPLITLRQRTSVLPIVFLHSGFRVLLGALGSTFYILHKPHPTWWHWFFAAAYAIPLVICFFVFSAMFSLRRKAQRPPNGTS
jgi:hypothetical protein